MLVLRPIQEPLKYAGPFLENVVWAVVKSEAIFFRYQAFGNLLPPASGLENLLHVINYEPNNQKGTKLERQNVLGN